MAEKWKLKLGQAHSSPSPLRNSCPGHVKPHFSQEANLDCSSPFYIPCDTM